VKDTASKTAERATAAGKDAQSKVGGLADQGKDLAGGATSTAKEKLGDTSGDKANGESPKLDIVRTAQGAEVKASGGSMGAGGIEITMQTTKEGTTLTIKIPGAFQQQ